MIRIIAFLILLFSAGAAGFAQNAYYDALKLHSAYTQGDYARFFQLLANQPGVSDAGKALAYSDIYAHFAQAAPMKSLLDSMLQKQTLVAQRSGGQVAGLQVKKTQLIQDIEKYLQGKIVGLDFQAEQLRGYREELLKRSFSDSAEVRVFKTVLEATLEYQLDAVLEPLTGQMRIEVSRRPVEIPGAGGIIPAPGSRLFESLAPAALAMLDKELLRIDREILALRQTMQLAGRGPQPGIDKTDDRLSDTLGLEAANAIELEGMWNELARTNAALRVAEQEMKQAAGLKSRGIGSRSLVAGPGLDAGDLYYTPQAVAPPASPVIVMAGTGGSFESNLLDATAGFIAERMKEELNVAFFDKFIRALENPGVGDLFPATRELLTRTESYNYSLVLDLVKEAFEKDLRKIPFNAPQLLRSYPWLVERREEAAYAILGGQVLALSVQGRHPADIISFLRDNRDTLLPPRFQQTFAYLDLVSASLRDTAGAASVWISKEKLQPLFKSNDLRNLYLGLLYRQLYDFTLSGQVQPDPAAVGLLDDSNRFFGVVGEFLSLVNGLEIQLKAIQEQRRNTGRLELTDLIPLYRNMLRLTGFSISAYAGHDDQVARFVQANDALLDIYAATSQRNYGLALVNALELIRLSLGEEFREHEAVLRYGSFMVALARARSAEEMQSVIRAMALPAGSYGIKRRNFFNISLNAYAGFAGGAEWAFNADTVRRAPAMGFTAPIGLALNWGSRQPVYRAGYMPGQRYVKVKRGELLTLRSDRPIRQKDSASFEMLDNHLAVSVQQQLIQYDGFQRLVVQRDTVSLLDYGLVGESADTLFQKEHPASLRRQQRIRRATRFYTPSGREMYISGSSASLFVSVLDLGALVLFRLDQATGPLPQTVSFRQVFSPGISYVYGLRDLPLAVHVGAQLTPQLRSIGESSLNAFRLSAGLTVDIPMFNFFTRTER